MMNHLFVSDAAGAGFGGGVRSVAYLATALLLFSNIVCRERGNLSRAALAPLGPLVAKFAHEPEMYLVCAGAFGSASLPPFSRSWLSRLTKGLDSSHSHVGVLHPAVLHPRLCAFARLGSENSALHCASRRIQSLYFTQADDSVPQISILNAGAIPGRLIPGFLADKFGPMTTALPFCVCTGALIFALLGATSTAATVVVLLLFGARSRTLEGYHRADIVRRSRQWRMDLVDGFSLHESLLERRRDRRACRCRLLSRLCRVTLWAAYRWCLARRRWLRGHVRVRRGNRPCWLGVCAWREDDCRTQDG